MNNTSSVPKNCSDADVSLLEKHVKPEIWRLNSLLAVNVMLVGVVVGIGAYAPRYRHHPLARFLFQGAAALFMPIMSYVVSATNNASASFIIYDDPYDPSKTLTGTCSIFQGHTICILLWTVFVQIAAINNTTVVAADARELGRSIAPSALLLIHAIWTCYLVILAGAGFHGHKDFSLKTLLTESHNPFSIFLCGVIFVKLVFKLGPFFMARRSFALGRNPRLVLGYMKKDDLPVLQVADVASSAGPSDHHVPPPPLLVMGEGTVNVQKGANSYTTVDNLQQRAAGLVTLDKVWQLIDDDTNYFLTRRTPEAGRLLKLKLKLKDVCLSFALFKLLRCRFARYTADELKFTWVENFFWQDLLLSTHDGGSSSSRVFKVIADELSFIHDYYYSSIGILYSNTWLPILTFTISLLTLGYTLFVALIMTLAIAVSDLSDRSQLACRLTCVFKSDSTVLWRTSDKYIRIRFGSFILFDLVPVLLLCVLLVLSEARDIASLFCSNWTKVVLICRYLRTNHHKTASSPGVINMPRRRSCAGCLLRCSCCKLVNHPWKDNINLCSILEMHPAPILCHLLRRLIPCLPLPEKTKSVKAVSDQVKSAIIDKLRSSKGRQLTKGTASLGSDNQNQLLWACSCGAEGSSTNDVLLVWHIATTILEVRYPSPSTTASSRNRVVATHLSGYCAYLVACCPELLPDDDGWSKDLYKAVKEDARKALAGVSHAHAPASSPEEEYKKLVQLLGADEDSRHKVVKNGRKLAGQLVELGEAKAWEVLAGFWSEMILYLAPSDNLDAHAAAIARGGELITLLWALLNHVGIITRPSASSAV